MDWRALLRPVGPQPPGVYWKRRAGAGLALALVLWLLVQLFAGGGDGRPAATTGSPTPTKAASSGPAKPRDLACGDTALQVSATADAASYPAGALPRFRVTVRNVGTTTCVIDLGPTRRFVTVSSGNDRIWSSKDCAPASPDDVHLAPGKAASTTFVWDRHRSAPGCADASRVPEAQGGTYVVKGNVVSLTTGGTVFRLSG